LYNQRILLLAILLVTIAAAYFTHVFWKKKINPRRSMGRFLLYVLLNLVSIFVLVFIFSLIINQYKEFFFKR